MNGKRDDIYKTSTSTIGSFVFDESVADVFEDMISRSVPGYSQIIAMLPSLSRRFKQRDAQYYDLGCSLGAGLSAIARGLDKQSGHLIGVDNSEAMLLRARQNLSEIQHQTVELRKEDLSDSRISLAAVVLLNFTLQFVPLQQRVSLLKDIYSGMLAGGVLVLSEKLVLESEDQLALLDSIHHQFKSDQGYSELEISRKREAIETVLIPETLETHLQRLKQVGFKTVAPWLQNLQFVSILAVK